LKTVLDRYRGCLVGLAIGDALGTTIEFKGPGSFEPITDIVGGGPFRLKAGQWTDDTSMALCLAESLLECHGFNPSDQMDRYVKWYREGYLSSTGTCFDIGNATRSALERYIVAKEPFSGTVNANSAGNGSIMRLAPVPLYYAKDPALAMKYCCESSLTTHGALECMDACKYLGSLIIGAIQGRDKETILNPLFHPIDGYWEKDVLCDKILAIAKGSFKRKNPPAIKGTGYVVDSLEAALWAFYSSISFEEGLLLAVNLGDDADTTGAVYGQLAGAFYGESALPGKWVKKLYDQSVIESLAENIYRQSFIVAG